MSLLERDQETIFALATPPGRGGIAVLRISGPDALKCVRRSCAFLPEAVESHRVYYGYLKNSNGENIDDVLVTYFAEGKSYTGQETIEVSCHGSPVLIGLISEVFLASGARNAERGEFTYRAFMNNRIDLVQAEGVLDLIESKSKSAARMASRQLKGELSSEFGKLESDLTWMLANMEADIDFSTEDIETYDAAELSALARSTLEKTNVLLASFKKGRVISQGLSVSIIGHPNVGKSSLLNALVKEDRAIVTDIAGTTRDLVSAEISVNGVSVALTDTAGLRATEDTVEKIGISKSIESMQESDLVFYLVDMSKPEMLEADIVEKLSDKRIFIIGNKADISDSDLSNVGIESVGSVKVSAKTGEGLDELRKILEREVQDLLVDDSPVVLNARHMEKLQTVRDSIEKTMGLLEQGESPEFTSFELQCALKATQELLGKIFDDQVMDRVFQEFCIGK